VSGDFVAVLGQQQQQRRDDDEEKADNENNIMINIAKRNISDRVDAPPPSSSKISSKNNTSLDEESWDVKMQSISNDHDVVGESYSDTENGN